MWELSPEARIISAAAAGVFSIKRQLLDENDAARLDSAIGVIPKSMSTREVALSLFKDVFQKAGLDRSIETERQPVAAHD
ncbi:MAG TPA: hypothetical protein VGL74_10680 [Terriglobales bacterium]|jgi:hypothetical protein